MPPLESHSTADPAPSHFHGPYMPIPNHMGTHLPPSPYRWPPRLSFNTLCPKPKGTSLFVVDRSQNSSASHLRNTPEKPDSTSLSTGLSPSDPLPSGLKDATWSLLPSLLPGCHDHHCAEHQHSPITQHQAGTPAAPGHLHLNKLNS